MFNCNDNYWIKIWFGIVNIRIRNIIDDNENDMEQFHIKKINKKITIYEEMVSNYII